MLKVQALQSNEKNGQVLRWSGRMVRARPRTPVSKIKPGICTELGGPRRKNHDLAWSFRPARYLVQTIPEMMFDAPCVLGTHFIFKLLLLLIF
jgi:hypothetical protein